MNKTYLTIILIITISISSVQSIKTFTSDEYGNCELSEFIAEHGANTRYEYDDESLLTFIISYDASNIDTILTFNPDLYHTNRFGKTALEIAIKENDFAGFKSLLSVIDINYYNKHKINLVAQAINNADSVTFHNFIIPHEKFRKDESHVYEILSQLLQVGADPNICEFVDGYCYTPVQGIIFPSDAFMDMRYGKRNYKLFINVINAFKQSLTKDKYNDVLLIAANDPKVKKRMSELNIVPSN